MKTLQQRVDKALDAAVFENEYVDLMTRTAGEVATDLADYCADLEDVPAKELIEAVKDYQVWYAAHVGTPTNPRTK